MKTLLLDWHLGLGDAIICCGLVRRLAQTHQGTIILPAHERNVPTVSHMFSDLPAVKVLAAEDNGEYFDFNEKIGEFERLCIGYRHPEFSTFKSFDQAFYALAKMPFETRWEMFSCPLSGNELRFDSRKNLVLIHEDPTRGFRVKPQHVGVGLGRPGVDFELVYIEPSTPRLTDWVYMLRDAAEIHCIDSSVMHLIESVLTRGKLFWHRCARNNGPFHEAVKRKKWIIVD